MADLIDREELLKLLGHQIVRSSADNDSVAEISHNETIADVIEMIKAQPPAGAERHAHWIPRAAGDFQCSNCTEGYTDDHTDNFCPKCGCKMMKQPE